MVLARIAIVRGSLREIASHSLSHAKKAAHDQQAAREFPFAASVFFDARRRAARERATSGRVRHRMAHGAGLIARWMRPEARSRRLLLAALVYVLCTSA